MAKSKLTETERFWSKVHKLNDPNGCWVWIGSHDQEGYGLFKVSKEGKASTLKAHRYSWELANNHKISTPLLQVCHTCDHHWCVNPQHLFLGTTQENTQDRHNKGRDAKGIRHGRSKLTPLQVSEILESPLSDTELANRCGVSRATVWGVRQGRAWKWVSHLKKQPDSP